jgi:hypothetical protein
MCDSHIWILIAAGASHNCHSNMVASDICEVVAHIAQFHYILEADNCWFSD